MRYILFLLIALILSAAPAQAQDTYSAPGVLVQSELLCYQGRGGVSYLLVATDEWARTYHIPGIGGYPVVSVLSSIPGDVTLTGELLTWRTHVAGDVAVVVGGGAAECPTAEGMVQPSYGAWLPLALR